MEYLYGGDGIGGEFGVYSTVTLEPNVIASFGDMNMLSNLSGEQFFPAQVYDGLDYWIDYVEAGKIGSTISASTTLSDQNGTLNHSLFDDVPIYTWYADELSPDGSLVNRTELQSTPNSDFIITNDDVGSYLSYQVGFLMMITTLKFLSYLNTSMLADILKTL